MSKNSNRKKMTKENKEKRKLLDVLLRWDTASLKDKYEAYKIDTKNKKQ